VPFQESSSEAHKDETGSIPKLLELNLEEMHKTWGDEVEDALRLQEDKMRGKAVPDRSRDFGLAPDPRRFDPGRNRFDGIRGDDRPPTKRMRDEPVPYRNQRDDGYTRDRGDRSRGARGRGKADSYRSGTARGSRSAGNDYRYSQGRDSIVSEYQPGRGEKRGTLTFERSDLHSERQASYENKRGGQYRTGDAGSRPGREDRNRESRGRENVGKKDDRVNTSRTPEGASANVSGGLVASSEVESVRVNAWSRPLHASQQGSELPTQSDEVPDVGPWNAGSQAPLSDSVASQPEAVTDAVAPGKDFADSRDKVDSEPPGNDRELGKRGESAYGRGDRGRRQSRRGRRQNWSDQVDGDENVPRYGRRLQARVNRDGRSSKAAPDDGNEGVDVGASRDDLRNQSDRRRTSRYTAGGRGLRQSSHGEYSVKSRGRGMSSVR